MFGVPRSKNLKFSTAVWRKQQQPVTLFSGDYFINAMKYFREKEILIFCGYHYQKIQVRCTKTYRTLPLLDKIPLMEYPIIYDYDEERLIIEGNNEYLLVNITTEEVEKKIDIKKLNINVGELFILRDKKTFVGRKNSSKKEYILFA